MAYVFLLSAIASELAGTSLLKLSNGFTRLWPTLGCLAAYGLSFIFLSQAVRTIPVAVSYAIWSGLGTAGIVAIAALFLGEPITLVRVLGIGLIVVGVVILNLGGFR